MMVPGVCLLVRQSKHWTLHANVLKTFVVPHSSIKRQYSNGTSNKTEIYPKNILTLHKRGVLHDIFPPASITLPDDLSRKQQTFYCGFDPTADSLHVGNLLSLMVMLHCQRAGHNVIAVIGTATVKAGDPSGRTTDRQPLKHNITEINAEYLTRCIQRIFKNHSDHVYDNRYKKELPRLLILKNHEWYERQSAIDFISSTCRNFRIGKMLGKKYIRERTENEDGILLNEFLYQVLQAYDWQHLHDTYDCNFQIGGIDQLGNIDAGHDLIKRTRGKDAYGLFTPLLTTPRGEKLGKSAGNCVWLSPEKTSPFEFYQYFFRQPDSVVEQYLKYFTFINLNAISEIIEEHRKNPGKRTAQRILAKNVCKLVHGPKGLELAERCTRALYGGRIEDLESLSSDEIDVTFSGMSIVDAVLEPDTTVYDAAIIAKAIPTGAAGYHVINSGGIRINGFKVKAPEQILLSGTHVLKNDITLISVGKIKHYIVRWVLPRIAHSEDDIPSKIPDVAVKDEEDFASTLR